MLEIRNLTKVYKTKGGTDTKALDNVSINFEETGLVFLLGKSGSGKSTLLNVAGGLDEPTSGEVIVMGKSSRNFTGSDFDSYRNTFVGFIFQEYNVLNEFSVEDNIALALELQGKSKDKQKIAELLHDVELDAYAKRKPNTLSGGQKQRIAIARALIKDPQIIMADEPTGALDSATGKQVFDTLKKLSETRLVIVVSHDREFAEIYGDRIVELKDGQIISDVKKRKDIPQQLDENITLIGKSTIAVKQGAKLTDENFKTIKKFIEESNGNLILTKGEREIEGFRRANRMDATGARESFSDTVESELNIKNYEGEKTKFIRSKLPVRKAIKIGASGLKLKPFRLVLTILLSVISFVMFGLFSTMMIYDGDQVLTESFMNSDYEFFNVKKYYQTINRVSYPGQDDYSYTSRNTAKFTPADIEKLAKGNKDAFGAFSFNSNINNASLSREAGDYYSLSIEMFAALPSNHSIRDSLTGNYPQKNNEIAISSYLLDSLKKSTFRTINEKGENVAEKTINSAQDVIGEYIQLSGQIMKITAVFDSGAIPAKYDALKEGEADFLTTMTFAQFISEGFYRLALVSESFIEENKDQFGDSTYVDYFDYCERQIAITGGKDITDNNNGEHRFYNYNMVKVYNHGSGSQAPITMFDSTKTSLANKEIILSLVDIINMFDFNNADVNFRYTSQEDYFERSETPIVLVGGKDVTDFINGDYNYYYCEHIKVFDANDNTQMPITMFDSAKTSLADDEIIVNIESFTNLFSFYNSDMTDEEDREYFEFQDAFSLLRDKQIYDYDLNETRPATEQELNEARKIVVAFLNKQDLSISALTEPARDNNYFFEGNYKVVGFYQNEDGGYTDGIYCSQAFYDLENLAMEKHKSLKLYREAIDILNRKEIYDNEIESYRPATKEELATAKATVHSFLKKQDLTVSVLTDSSKNGDYRFEGNYKVVGYYEIENGNNGIYCSQEFYDMVDVNRSEQITTKYEKEKDAIYHVAFVPFEKNETSLKAFFGGIGENHINPDTDVFYELSNALYSNVDMANNLVETLSTVFLWVGIVLALFASLLLFNFISMSISNKKKEIGILRAVGARGIDVFKIFFAESGIIVGICTILSLVGTVILTGVLNSILKTEVGLDVALFVFGGLSVGLMIGVALAVALISTFLPVYFAARKKPVESIRAL